MLRVLGCGSCPCTSCLVSTILSNIFFRLLTPSLLPVATGHEVKCIELCFGLRGCGNWRFRGRDISSLFTQRHSSIVVFSMPLARSRLENVSMYFYAVYMPYCLPFCCGPGRRSSWCAWPLEGFKEEENRVASTTSRKHKKCGENVLCVGGVVLLTFHQVYKVERRVGGTRL